MQNQVQLAIDALKTDDKNNLIITTFILLVSSRTKINEISISLRLWAYQQVTQVFHFKSVEKATHFMRQQELSHRGPAILMIQVKGCQVFIRYE
jgi:hypothetical protein